MSFEPSQRISDEVNKDEKSDRNLMWIVPMVQGTANKSGDGFLVGDDGGKAGTEQASFFSDLWLRKAFSFIHGSERKRRKNYFPKGT